MRKLKIQGQNACHRVIRPESQEIGLKSATKPMIYLLYSPLVLFLQPYKRVQTKALKVYFFISRYINKLPESPPPTTTLPPLQLGSHHLACIFPYTFLPGSGGGMCIHKCDYGFSLANKPWDHASFNKDFLSHIHLMFVKRESCSYTSILLLLTSPAVPIRPHFHHPRQPCSSCEN